MRFSSTLPDDLKQVLNKSLGDCASSDNYQGSAYVLQFYKGPKNLIGEIVSHNNGDVLEPSNGIQEIRFLYGIKQ